MNIEEFRYKLNKEATLTFNTAESRDPTIIILTFLQSMQETVQMKIISFDLIQ